MLIFLAGLYLAPLYLFVLIFLPLLIIVQVVRLDTRYAAASLAVAGLILLIITNKPVLVIILLTQYGLLGILYGLLFKNQVSSGANLGTGMFGGVVLALCSAGLIYAMSGVNIFLMDQQSRLMAEELLASGPNTAAFGDLPPEWQEDFSGKMIAIFELFIPGQYIMTSIVTSIIIFFMARILLRRLSFRLPPGIEFTRMSFPWQTVWAAIAGLAFTLAGDHFGLQLMAKTGKNILFILFYFYLALGFAVAAYYFCKVSLALPFKVIIVVAALFNLPFTILFIVMLGMADPLVNFRRLSTDKT